MKELKHCTKCDRDLPLTAYNKNKSNKDGLGGWCRDCQNVAQRASNAKAQATPGPCNLAGCSAPRRQFSTGNYHTLCAEHGREDKRKQYQSEKKRGTVRTPKPGRCGKPGCEQPRELHDSGRYSVYCRMHRQITGSAWRRDNPDKQFFNNLRSESKKRLKILADMGVDVSEFIIS